MAQKLSEEGLRADVILTSTAKRAQETVKLLTETWSPAAEILNESGLYLASPEEIVCHIHALHDSWNTALIVGHNPGMVSLCCLLAGRELEMPTAAVALFRFPGETWQNCIPLPEAVASGQPTGDWRLVALWKPRDLE